MITLITERARSVLHRLTPGTRTEVDALREEIDRLRADVDELRRDNLRIAQLHDVVVDRLAGVAADSAEPHPHEGGHRA